VKGAKRSRRPTRPAALEELPTLVEYARRGEAAALPRLREALEAHPEVWRRAGELAAAVQAAWLDLLAGSDPAARESFQRQVEGLRRGLAGPGASVAEALLAEAAAAGWLEAQYRLRAQARGLGGASGRQRTATAQRRFQASLKALTALKGAAARATAPADCLLGRRGEEEKGRQA
jgi:hypothetical protein